MLAELLKRPLFWVFWVCMFLTAAAELAPGQWVNISLSNIVGMQGILLLVYVSALMFVMRHFAGPIVARISSVGLMFASCLAAGIGLYLLSLADSPALAFAAATVWGIGVCYMWPTMLAIVSERFPRGGAMAMGLMGFAGGMSIQFVLPQMGAIFDSAKAQAAGGADTAGDPVAGGDGGSRALRLGGILPVRGHRAAAAVAGVRADLVGGSQARAVTGRKQWAHPARQRSAKEDDCMQVKIGMNMLLWGIQITPQHIPVFAESRRRGLRRCGNSRRRAVDSRTQNHGRSLR